MINKSLISVLVCIFGVASVYAQPNWSATVNVAGGGSFYDINFGFSPDATDGYDANFDMYAPPSPPTGFDTALTWAGDRYYTQILAGDDDLSEHEYGISLAYPSDNTIIISWDNTGWSDKMTSCLLQDAFGGLMGINVDMLSETTWTLTNTAFTALLLKVTPTIYQSSNTAPSFTVTDNADVTVNEDNGEYNGEDWATDIIPGPNSEYGQTLTFTLTTDNDALFSVLPAITFVGSYPVEGDLIFTPGDDLHGTATVTVVLSDDGGTGDGGVDTSEPLEFTITVNSVNDPPSMTIPENTVVDMNSGPVTIEGWATDISAGADNESDQTVMVESINSNSCGQCDAYFATPPQLDLESGNLSFEWLSDISTTITWRIVYSDNEGASSNQFFDLQSTGDTLVTITNPEDGSTLNSGDFSVEFTTTVFTIGEAGCSDCDGHVHVLVDGAANAYGEYMVYSEGPIPLTGVPAGAHSITIQLVDPNHQAFDPSIESTVNVTIDIPLNISSNNIPGSFNLLPNYPNPFNPFTTFHYTLPQRSRVTLIIYDMLGKEITQLVSTTQDAGFKSVQWDAKDSMGRPVSAGVYLYHIKAGEFVQIRKMVLLK